MIYYATKETLERYKLKTPEEMTEPIQGLVKAVKLKEQGRSLYEWGCKLFHFDGRKCLQVIHFKTRLVIFLVDVKMADIEHAPDMVAHYLFDIYSGDGDMQIALEKYFESSPLVCFDRLTNRSIVSKLNHMQADWAWDGKRFYEYIVDGILHTRKINRDVNDYPFSTKENGKTEWKIPYDYFAEAIKCVFGRKNNNH